MIIAASAAFIVGILMAAPPGPVGLWDYIGLTIAAVACTLLLMVFQRRRGTPRIL